mmetsp:Transcript_5632/g.6519  ORF Transcript_5632/g.6519 Transcript_5632/m.6519 type:complete len:121 (+) Transcript_5632:155-517(+)
MFRRNTLSAVRHCTKQTVGPNRMSFTRQKHYLLQYKYVPDVLEKRDPFRPNHLGLIKEFYKEGKVVMGGAFADPVDGALIIFDCNTKEEVEAFVSQDPYHLNSLVTEYTIREWTTVPLED